MEEIVLFEGIVLPILGMGLGAFAMFGVYRTFNRWLERRHERRLSAEGGSAVAAGAVERLEARLEAVEDLALRMQDLEERLDFTERVLARGQEPGRLGRPG